MLNDAAVAILPVVSFDIFFLSAYKNGIIQQEAVKLIKK